MNEKELRAYQPQPVDASKVEHVHLIGVAGTGMGTLAGMLKKAGYLVTGSDKGIYPPMSEQLEIWGIETMEGFRAEHLQSNPDLVIVGNACKPSNPEAHAAIASGIPCTSMPRAVHDFFLKDRDVVVVAGTHGKTTTTTLTGWLLESAGLDPGVLVGGVSANFDGSFQLPQGKHFVIEGDEYDSALFDKVPKFVHYAPKYAVLTSVEFDHADIYPDIDAVKAAFLSLMDKVPEDGALWVCGHYPLALEVAESAKAKTLTYGLSPRFDLHAENITWGEDGVAFNLFLHDRSVGRFELPMFGDFNVLNALAAIGVALHLDIPVPKIQEGVATFKGIRRRQDIYATIGKMVVIDDFAHHPTAIKGTTEAVRKRYQKRRIWGVFEPRSNTARRNFFQDELPKCFEACDRVVLSEPFHSDKMATDERLNVEKVIAELEAMGKDAKVCPHADAIASLITSKARPDDVIVVMSNGGFGGLLPKLRKGLEERFKAPPLVVNP